MNNDKKKTAETIGRGLAFIQDAVDRTVAWGFGKLKNVNKDAEKEENKIIKVARQAGGFIGETGSEFYKEYERLKSLRKEK
jgi:hypothetical protein